MLKIIKVEVQATPGSELDDCILDAIFTSYTNQCDVILTHNSIQYYFDKEKVKKGIDLSYYIRPRKEK